ncbi:MAG: hypothetical protein GYB65_13320, partial [Chloroflexi bacterium]|nr:hypothetical protein [Chloroflexota bacterium]
MAYLLILPVALYITLASMIVQRQPRGLSSYALAIYLVAVAGATAAYLVLGTTAKLCSAEIAAVALVLLSSWIYLVFFPLAILGLYFEQWAGMHWRGLSLGGGVLMAGVDAVLVWDMAANADPLVYPLSTGYGLHWILSQTAFSIPLSAGLLLFSQFPLLVVMWAALRYRHLALWRGVLPLVVCSVLSLLVPLLSPLAGERWGLTVAALG